MPKKTSRKAGGNRTPKKVPGAPDKTILLQKEDVWHLDRKWQPARLQPPKLLGIEASAQVRQINSEAYQSYLLQYEQYLMALQSMKHLYLKTQRRDGTLILEREFTAPSTQAPRQSAGLSFNLIPVESTKPLDDGTPRTIPSTPSTVLSTLPPSGPPPSEVTEYRDVLTQDRLRPVFLPQEYEYDGSRVVPRLPSLPQGSSVTRGGPETRHTVDLTRSDCIYVTDTSVSKVPVAKPLFPGASPHALDQALRAVPPNVTRTWQVVPARGKKAKPPTAKAVPKAKPVSRPTPPKRDPAPIVAAPVKRPVSKGVPTVSQLEAAAKRLKLEKQVLQLQTGLDKAKKKAASKAASSPPPPAPSSSTPSAKKESPSKVARRAKRQAIYGLPQTPEVPK